MTKEEKKRYLSGYTQLERSVEERLGELERLQTLQSRLPAGEAVQRSAAQLQRQLEEEMDACVRKRARISSLIAGAGEGTARILLEYRYLQGCTWEQIAEKLHYSTMQIHRIHNRAPEKLPSEWN